MISPKNSLIFILVFILPTSFTSAWAGRELSFSIDKPYLIIPVKTNALKHRMRIDIDGAFFDEFDVELPAEEPDFYAFIDLRRHKGKKIRVSMPNLKDQYFKSAENIQMADEIPGFDSLYNESLRPGFHYTPRRGWLSDPDGLFYYDGAYHMYYQHNPYGWYCLNMHWGHATSKDLIHWQELPDALYPPRYGDWVWSGGAVVDKDNTSGFQKGDNPPIVAIYTSSGRGECVAYSNDGGVTFKQYERNPVLTGATANRDPQIIWYEPGKHWVMARNYSFEGKEYIGFYTSADLKHWAFQSKEGFFHSCPEFFELPVEGRKNVTKWVIHDMFGLYKIGDFDGKRFNADVKEKIKYNYGTAFVASRTFNNLPGKKQIALAFSYNGVAPGMPFNNCMLFPVELRLRETSSGIRMCPKPIDAIDKLHDISIKAKDKSVTEINEMLEAGANLGDTLHLKVQLDSVKDKFILQINGVTITIDPNRDTLICKGNLTPPVKPIVRTAINKNGEVEGPVNTSGVVELEVLLDKTTLEIFANDGEMYMPVGLYFHPNMLAGIFGKPVNETETKPFMDVSKRGIKLITRDKNTTVASFEVYTMKSMWE